MANLYVMITEDRHTDVDVRVFADRELAVSTAVAYAYELVHGTGTTVDHLDVDGSETYLTWGEDYAVRVVAREVTA